MVYPHNGKLHGNENEKKKQLQPLKPIHMNPTDITLTPKTAYEAINAKFQNSRNQSKV